MNEKEKNYMEFLRSVGQGCISGDVYDWPQLKPACEWAYFQIEKVKGLEEALDRVGRGDNRDR